MAFAACLGNVNLIGWSNSLFGVLGCVLSFVMGYVIKYIGSTGGIILMLSISFARSIFVISWIPEKEQLYVIYFMVAGFAVSQSVGSGQVRALYGVYFPNNPTSFSYCAINQTFGLFIGSMISKSFSTAIKTYVLIGIIITSFICYVILLIINKNNPKHQMSDDKRIEEKLILKINSET